MNMKKIHDVSMPLRKGMPCFPGDPAFQKRFFARMSRGDVADTSFLTMSAHTGTHIDAPSHMLAGDRRTLDRIPLAAFFGPARLFHFPRAKRIDAAMLARLDWRGIERALFRTSNSARWAEGAHFFKKFVTFTADAARFLAARRLMLVGIDSLSIDPYESEDHPAHRTFLTRGIAVVEGMYFAGVPAGDYLLSCAPLRITGGDGAPARAVLVNTHAPRPVKGRSRAGPRS